MAEPASMIDKLWFLIPEIVLFGGVVVVSVMGLARRRIVRDAVPLVVCVFLVAAMAVIPFLYGHDRVFDELGRSRAGLLMPLLGRYVKLVVCAVGILLAMMSVWLTDRKLEAAVASGRARFDPIRVSRGEYFAFFLLSLIGVMLVCNANDLIWLFLALELTSLPTYIMVAISRPSAKALEAAVKYFFLGALSAGMFLYGFALLYGASGTIVLTEMRDVFAEQAAAGGLNSIALIGMLISLLGVSFKIVAVPMHFYAADVYEGAAAPVTAFLAFVPKTAGILAIMLLVSTVGYGGRTAAGIEGLPQPIMVALWMICVLTMTLGNVGALLQRSAKRLLAYSSIAHSGYLLIGIIAGPALGFDAVLFYLLAYGVMNTAAFAVLAGLQRRGEEIESLDDLAGLRARHPAMAVVMALAALSLVGFPPLLGFWGKLSVFIAGVEAGRIALVVIALINSAISAYYYLWLVGLPILAMPNAQSQTVVKSKVVWPRVAAVLAAVAVVVLPFFAQRLLSGSQGVGTPPAQQPLADSQRARADSQ
ncbi:MAG: NADH-quinone oxidoreductase subunit N [Planctomycetes bacterium]|nr:NADH-quinone oxidoreductase subunit N [Planctomycetota bacterium]